MRKAKFEEEEQDYLDLDLDELSDYLNNLMKQAFPKVYDSGDDDREFWYTALIPVNVKSDFVNIRNMSASCYLYKDRLRVRFIGCDKPTSVLLDPLIDESDDNVPITETDEYGGFEKYIFIEDDTTESAKQKIKDVFQKFVAHRDEAIELWKEMQGFLDRYDDLRGKLDRLSFEFDKKL